MIRALATAIAATALAGCGSGGGSEDAPRGKTLFIERCGSCHALADAGTGGDSLDLDRDLRAVDEARVLKSIVDPPSGMPEDLAQGADAEAISEYVAQNRTPREP